MDSVDRLIAELNALSKQLREAHGAVAFWGCELEWYLEAPRDADVFAAIWQEAGRPVVPEKGPNQFETAWGPTGDAAKLIADVNRFKARLSEATKRHDATVSFAPKPFPGERGSALQIHIHLESPNGKRLFEKQGDQLSQPLRDALGGLLATLPESMAVFAPTADSKRRFIAGQDAPTTVSWGANNRTVALRLPMKSGALCHIEHRVPGADADIAACMVEVLKGVLYGLEHHPDPGPQMFGDAAAAHHELPRL